MHSGATYSKLNSGMLQSYIFMDEITLVLIIIPKPLAQVLVTISSSTIYSIQQISEIYSNTTIHYSNISKTSLTRKSCDTTQAVKLIMEVLVTLATPRKGCNTNH